MAEHPILTVYFSECESGQATMRSLAVLYAMIIAAKPEVLGSDWRTINEAANKALGFTIGPDLPKIDRFRKAAWAIHDAAAVRQTSMREEAAHVG